MKAEPLANNKRLADGAKQNYTNHKVRSEINCKEESWIT